MRLYLLCDLSVLSGDGDPLLEECLRLLRETGGGFGDLDLRRLCGDLDDFLISVFLLGDLDRSFLGERDSRGLPAFSRP